MPESAESHPVRAVSAPGKVLLAGGYLVLDRSHTGLVFGLNARINAVVQNVGSSPGVQFNEIIVKSPQFVEATWKYGYHLVDSDGGFKVTQLQSGTTPLVENKFVETTLNYVLTYVVRVDPGATAHSIPSSLVTIMADNDYYSHGPGTATVGGMIQNPHHPHHPHGSTRPHSGRFQVFATTIAGAHKTGLGSSAALVTSLVGALLSFYLPKERFDITSPEGKRVLHNLAQAAHCAAQGKVGSGFDVAAAVYGSCVYKRFSPSTVTGIPAPGSPGFGASVYTTVTGQWDTEVKNGSGTTSLPPGLVLRMADVDCGSSTVNMVKKVLAWKEAHPEASTRIWNQLQDANDKLAQVLQSGEIQADEIRTAISSVRALLREMGTAAEVEIEPEPQTKLLDAASNVEGVYGGVVPGAGGFDALALLVKDDVETKQRLDTFFSQWRRDTGTKVKLLGVMGEMEGARLEENLDPYRGWI